MIGFAKKNFDRCFCFGKFRIPLLIIGKSFCHGDSFTIGRLLPIFLAQTQVGDKLFVLGIKKSGESPAKLLCQLLMICCSIQFINIIIKHRTQNGAGSKNIRALPLQRAKGRIYRVKMLPIQE